MDEVVVPLDLNSLPQDCISTVLAFTSPIEACRSSLLSSSFRSAADSDAVWDRFLPSDYKQILQRSVSPIEFSSKKDLYLRLHHDPILIDGGNKIFSLDKSTGKIRYMLCARALSISDGNNPLCWSWKSLQYFWPSLFSEVAILRSVSSLEIDGKIKTCVLSPKTTYGAYLIVKFEERAYGLDSIPSELLVEDGNNNVCRGIAYLRRRHNSQKQQLERLYLLNRMQMLRSKVMDGEERVVHERDDGWMEIELGEFYINNNGSNDDKQVKMSLMEVKGNQLKGGLIVEGIEVRPKVSRGSN
ncbi:F-box domain [Macleaya cordata]|uniref:F-box domain n=1 Tax=Macleaya cordata TaxID=56857 RepID=A0A200PWQ3_MACCD|nr:F-box domain [Macleaya cordata]